MLLLEATEVACRLFVDVASLRPRDDKQFAIDIDTSDISNTQSSFAVVRELLVMIHVLYEKRRDLFEARQLLPSFKSGNYQVVTTGDQTSCLQYESIPSHDNDLCRQRQRHLFVLDLIAEEARLTREIDSHPQLWVLLRDFLISCCEPVSRTTHINEYRMCSSSLNAAASEARYKISDIKIILLFFTKPREAYQYDGGEEVADCKNVSNFNNYELFTLPPLLEKLLNEQCKANRLRLVLKQKVGQTPTINSPTNKLNNNDNDANALRYYLCCSNEEYLVELVKPLRHFLSLICFSDGVPRLVFSDWERSSTQQKGEELPLWAGSTVPRPVKAVTRQEPFFRGKNEGDVETVSMAAANKEGRTGTVATVVKTEVDENVDSKKMVLGMKNYLLVNAEMLNDEGNLSTTASILFVDKVRNRGSRFSLAIQEQSSMSKDMDFVVSEKSFVFGGKHGRGDAINLALRFGEKRAEAKKGIVPLNGLGRGNTIPLNDDDGAKRALVYCVEVQLGKLRELKRTLFEQLGILVDCMYDFGSDMTPLHPGSDRLFVKNFYLKEGVQLRPHQRASLERFCQRKRAALPSKISINSTNPSYFDAISRQGNVAHHGIVVLPCGAGKTLTGIAASAMVGKRTICLCVNVISVLQWRDQFMLWTNLKQEQITICTKDDKDMPGDVFITTYNMIVTEPYVDPTQPKSTNVQRREKIMNIVKSTEWGMLVLDEVHMAPADCFQKVVDRISHHCVLGLTATVLREDAKVKDLRFLVGPKLYEANWLELTHAGHLAPVMCAEIRCPSFSELLKDYLFSGDGELSSGATGTGKCQLVNPCKLWCTQALLAFHESRVPPDKTIIFCDSIPAVKFYARALGVPYMDGGTGDVERVKVLKSFRFSTKINTVVLSRVGDVALDLPEANVVIQVSGLFSSKRQEAQRLGRILRRKPSSLEHGYSYFYTLVSEDTEEVAESHRRQSWLRDQGYHYRILMASDIGKWWFRLLKETHPQVLKKCTNIDKNTAGILGMTGSTMKNEKQDHYNPTGSPVSPSTPSTPSDNGNFPHFDEHDYNVSKRLRLQLQQQQRDSIPAILYQAPVCIGPPMWYFHVPHVVVTVGEDGVGSLGLRSATNAYIRSENSCHANQNGSLPGNTPYFLGNDDMLLKEFLRAVKYAHVSVVWRWVPFTQDNSREMENGFLRGYHLDVNITEAMKAASKGRGVPSKDKVHHPIFLSKGEEVPLRLVFTSRGETNRNRINLETTVLLGRVLLKGKPDSGLHYRIHPRALHQHHFQHRNPHVMYNSGIGLSSYASSTKDIISVENTSNVVFQTDDLPYSNGIFEGIAMRRVNEGSEGQDDAVVSVEGRELTFRRVQEYLQENGIFETPLERVKFRVRRGKPLGYVDEPNSEHVRMMATGSDVNNDSFLDQEFKHTDAMVVGLRDRNPFIVDPRVQHDCVRQGCLQYFKQHKFNVHYKV